MSQQPAPSAEEGAFSARVAELLLGADHTHAYHLILQRHGPGVRGYLRAKTGSDQHGDALYDALRDSLWDHLPELAARLGQTTGEHAQPLSVRAWLYRCASNRFLSWQARRSRDLGSPSLVAQLAGRHLPGPSTELRYHRLVQQILAELTEAEAEIFILRAERDLSFAEIAEVLDVSEGAARQSYHRARQKLKALLTPPEGA